MTTPTSDQIGTAVSIVLLACLLAVVVAAVIRLVWWILP